MKKIFSTTLIIFALQTHCIYSQSTYRNTMVPALGGPPAGVSNVAFGTTSFMSNLGGLNNTAIGVSALFSNTSGSFNSALGGEALYSNISGIHNTALGHRSMRQNGQGSWNTSIGFVSLYSNTAGNQNTATGDSALYSNTGGGFNTANGNSSLHNNISGTANTAIGWFALHDNNLNNANTAVGAAALFKNTAHNNTAVGFSTLRNNITGNNNLATGIQAMVNNNSGNFNSAVGCVALLGNITGNNNVGVGFQSLSNNVSGSFNSAFGSGANVGPGTPNLTNATAIGANAIVMNSNQMILGDNSVNVGIGLSSVGAGAGNKLEINTPAGSPVPGASGLRFTDLTSISTPLANPGPGVLSVDKSGDVIYVPGGGGGPVIANNGLQVSGGGFVQLGGQCGNTSEINNAQFLTDRVVKLNNNNIWFSGIQSNATNGPGGRVGIGIMPTTCFPGNRLEIFNNVIGSTVSGLRLTDLSTLPSPMPNPGTGVLSVDANGDVIYVQCCGSGGLGNLCSNPPLPISGPYQIELASNNFNFTTPPNTPGQVLIGNTSCGVLPARLAVSDDNFGTGIYSDAFTAGTNNIGVRGAALSVQPLQRNVGVLGESMVFSNNAGAGVAGFAGPAAVSAIPFVGGIGVYGNSTLNNAAWAAYFDGHTASNGNILPVGSCNWFLGSPTDLWNKVYTCNGVFQSSDRRKKENITTLNYGLNEIMKLKPISYTWINDPAEGRKIGFIAQELKEVIKEVVHEGNDENKSLTVNYAELVVLLTKGMQEQQDQIEKQDQQISELKEMVQSLASNGSASRPNDSQAVELSDRDVIVLDQNVPNPWAENTVITYSIPNDFTKAQIIFNTTDGKVIRTVDITTKGKGRLNVFANDLSNGMYSYTLIVDGKIIDTKKMVKD